MTPLHIEIIMHYHCCRSDYRDGDFSAPAVREYIDELRRAEMIMMDGDKCIYKIAPRGSVYVEAICKTPLPVQKWVMPE